MPRTIWQRISFLIKGESYRKVRITMICDDAGSSTNKCDASCYASIVNLWWWLKYKKRIARIYLNFSIMKSKRRRIIGEEYASLKNTSW